MSVCTYMYLCSQVVVISKIFISVCKQSVLELFGSRIWCLLSIYHSFLFAIEMCKFTEMEQKRQEVHLSKSLRGSRWLQGQDLHLVSLSLISHTSAKDCSV